MIRILILISLICPQQEQKKELASDESKKLRRQVNALMYELGIDTVVKNDSIIVDSLEINY